MQYIFKKTNLKNKQKYKDEWTWFPEEKISSDVLNFDISMIGIIFPF